MSKYSPKEDQQKYDIWNEYEVGGRRTSMSVLGPWNVLLSILLYEPGREKCTTVLVKKPFHHTISKDCAKVFDENTDFLSQSTTAQLTQY